jgi:predicted nucleic acid-binding protein
VAPLGIVVALLDTTVLFPFYLRDTLLRAAELELYQARWSRDILAELQRVLVEHRRTDETQVRRLIRAMRAAFPEAEEVGYQSLIESMTNDPGDRHVLAAAVHAKADVLVTSNVRHFPKRSVEPHGIQVQSANAFLLERLEQAPEQMLRILWDQATEFRAPRMTVGEILDRLATTAPRYAAALRSML